VNHRLQSTDFIKIVFTTGSMGGLARQDLLKSTEKMVFCAGGSPQGTADTFGGDGISRGIASPGIVKVWSREAAVHRNPSSF
jgi:hypothetical protein